MIRARVVVCVALPALTTVGAVAQATPRLAAQYGQNCQLCHVNPTGGGMRTSYLSQFIAPSELAWKPLPAHDQSRFPKPQINDQISVGTDLRLLYLGTNNTTTNAGKLDNTFFQMQGDVYLAFQPDPQFLIYLDKGLYGGFETFAQARILSAHGYLKAGQFVPDLGWRWDDHTHFTREKLGLGFPGATDAGVEVGINPGPLVATAGVFNGASGGMFDADRYKAIVSRFLYRWRIRRLQAALGGSTRWNRTADLRERLWGIQGQASWGPLSYTGDVYWQGLDSVANSGPRNWSLVLTEEVVYRAHRGLELYIGYDFRDPDLDRATGAQYYVTFGSRLYPRHFLSIEPMYRLAYGPLDNGGRYDNRFQVILHAFY
ncbi:MAG: hypothetical protein HY304_08450 [candidate division Zixibacteria bacterium]|nr:hypothetical protein [candidate division Zixibacteria bacterium]